MNPNLQGAYSLITAAYATISKLHDSYPTPANVAALSNARQLCQQAVKNLAAIRRQNGRRSPIGIQALTLIKYANQLSRYARPFHGQKFTYCLDCGGDGWFKGPVGPAIFSPDPLPF